MLSELLVMGVCMLFGLLMGHHDTNENMQMKDRLQNNIS